MSSLSQTIAAAARKLAAPVSVVLVHQSAGASPFAVEMIDPADVPNGFFLHAAGLSAQMDKVYSGLTSGAVILGTTAPATLDDGEPLFMIENRSDFVGTFAAGMYVPAGYGMWLLIGASTTPLDAFVTYEVVP